MVELWLNVPRLSYVNFYYCNKKLSYGNSHVKHDDVSQLSLIEARIRVATRSES